MDLPLSDRFSGVVAEGFLSDSPIDDGKAPPIRQFASSRERDSEMRALCAIQRAPKAPERPCPDAPRRRSRNFSQPAGGDRRADMSTSSGAQRLARPRLGLQRKNMARSVCQRWVETSQRKEPPGVRLPAPVLQSRRVPGLSAAAHSSPWSPLPC